MRPIALAGILSVSYSGHVDDTLLIPAERVLSGMRSTERPAPATRFESTAETFQRRRSGDVVGIARTSVNDEDIGSGG